MIQFLKDAIREFKHVVWPTRKETQKYFSLVLAILVFFGLYLFIASNIFSEIVFGLKSLLGTDTGSSISSALSQDEIDALFSNEATIDATVEGGTGTTIEISTEETEIPEVTEDTGTGEIAE
jgi:preprotein translocase SecE subunit